jgi:phosphoglycerate dehydrogenase-like enzyme
MAQAEVFVGSHSIKIVILDQFADIYVKALEPAFPGVEFTSARSADEAMPLMKRAQALFALAPAIPEALIAAAPGLQWIQALTTGVDNLVGMETLPDNVVITSTRGVHGPQMAEMALMLMMALSRALPRIIANQGAQRWERWPQPMLWRKTIAIVGVGAIAETLAARCKAFEMDVVGISSSARQITGFDHVYSRDDLHKAVAAADFVIVLTPYSAQSHHMIDATVMAAMKPDAYLINLARGGVVDETALLEALETGKIAGAALDVFAEEPLPPGHRLWNAQNLIVTPHLGGMSEGYEQQVLPILQHNLHAFLREDFAAMQNLVTALGHD